VVAAGGTAGHVVPAIAVADALRAEGAEVSFIGTRERAEADLVPAAGYRIDFVAVSGLSRTNPLKAVAAAVRSLRGIGAARRLLGERGADAVLGGGGYVAAPVGLAAVRMGIPLVLTEADSHLGLANRILARWARRVCLAFSIPGREGDRYLVTGRPVPRQVIEADRDRARARFALAGDQPCVAVFGGSLGARSINEAAYRALIEPRGWRIVHVAGSRDYPELRRRYEADGSPPHYTLIEYEPGLGEVLAASDLVVSRAGGSVFEIAAAGRPAVLIPYPHATGDHQTANARWMAGAGAAELISDSELGPEALLGTVSHLLSDPGRLETMASASLRLARPDAARRVADELLAAIGRGAAPSAAGPGAACTSSPSEAPG
jgi:UDP-N-acetylglucosamine--N-acetylmuramyl-(pentapeptide) pyrophosphoryl-undecaprenol N-acetylglucosamine transferase